MRPSLSVIPGSSLKQLKLTSLLLVCPLYFFAQSLSGLWTGVLTNDSNSIRQDQSFEIALTEYRGKVYGYSRSEFIVNDTLYYIVKRVKGIIDGDACAVKDDEIIACNFLKRLNKGVKVTSTFYRNKIDSTWYLAGKWKTNQTKNYYTVTGKVALQEEKDLTNSKLFPHLEELNLANDVAFYKERKTESVMLRTAEPENRRFESLIKNERQTTLGDPVSVSTQPDINTVDLPVVPVTPTQIIRTATEPVKTGVTAIPVKTDASIAKAELKKDPERQKTIVKIQPQTTLKEPVTISVKPDTKIIAPTGVPVNSTQVIRTATELVKPELVSKPLTPEIKIPSHDPVVTTALTAGRKSEFSQVVNFKSDSLELALYDNGEIDGDTVSVFLNGEEILAKQGLKAAAIKKTIYITPGKEEFSLVLYADNLGKYPPNTGLLVVHDGEDVYNIRFNADFQKNAGVVFQRKK